MAYNDNAIGLCYLKSRPAQPHRLVDLLCPLDELGCSYLVSATTERAEVKDPTSSYCLICIEDDVS
jgi:hypothetical protein